MILTIFKTNLRRKQIFMKKAERIEKFNEAKQEYYQIIKDLPDLTGSVNNAKIMLLSQTQGFLKMEQVPSLTFDLFYSPSLDFQHSFNFINIHSFSYKTSNIKDLPDLTGSENRLFGQLILEKKLLRVQINNLKDILMKCVNYFAFNSNCPFKFHNKPNDFTIIIFIASFWQLI